MRASAEAASDPESAESPWKTSARRATKVAAGDRPLEEADAFVRLRDEFGLSTAEIALRAGKTQR
jgi:hypothetical protein